MVFTQHIIPLPMHPTASNSPSQVRAAQAQLRPHCPANERIFQWRGINTPPTSALLVPLIQHVWSAASRASLSDAGSYGSGLRKFHIFCDIFSIPEELRLPASANILHSFVLWATADPECLSSVSSFGVPLEPISVVVARKYLAAVRAWHIVQGWPSPLSPSDMDSINWSLRGLERIQQGKRKHPPRPPITTLMLSALKAHLNIALPFDACVWAMASCTFWGMMRFGEVSVKSRRSFNGDLHLKRSDAYFGHDLQGKQYAKLSLPSAKTAAPGETQSVFLTEQGDLCPLQALINLSMIVPAGANDPLFSWRDKREAIRPMVKGKALLRINGILMSMGWGTSFGHSFRIGGASYFLAKKVDPEIVRLAGRWKSLAYQTYIRAFEHIVSIHMSNIDNSGDAS